MRHIPEEELHAYLDQALSRSQCVEIERHLARCPRCRTERDFIASLRDRTTELLSRIGPPPIIPQSFESLRLRAVLEQRRRRRAVRTGIWAASLLLAGGLGWQLNWGLHRRAVPSVSAAVTTVPELAPTPMPEAPATHLAPGGPPARGTLLTSRAQAPASLPQLVRAAPVSSTPIRFARAVELDPVSPGSGIPSPILGELLDAPDPTAQPVSGDPGLQGLWRTIIPDSAATLPSNDMALVPGLPVIQMRVQPGQGTSEVTAVDQVLESGEMIRTIAGPAGRVGSLVDAEGSTHAADTPGDPGARMTVTIRQGDRMVAVTGPSQALGSLLSRVNYKRRRY